MLPDWSLAPVVAALQTMRGMALVNAATLIAELGAITLGCEPAPVSTPNRHPHRILCRPAASHATATIRSPAPDLTVESALSALQGQLRARQELLERGAAGP